MNHDIDTVLTAYLECALWSSTDFDGAPLDDIADVSDFTPDALKESREDVIGFLQDCADSGLSTDLLMSDEQLGHDFWLTRNGHGAGFWDRGYGKDGDALTALCKPYGSVDLYVDEAGMVHA